jgi:hypothetical protein
MDPITKDLNRWIPHLLEVWRRHRRRKEGPSNRPLPDEFREIVSGVKTLSAGLTGKRRLVGKGYMDDPALLGAYLMFYWPVSYAQARYAMGHLSSRPRSVLDLGSGPAPMSFASLDHGAGDVVVADRSERALRLATELAGEAGEPLAVRRWNPLKGEGFPEGEYDLIVMGHLLNELWVGVPDEFERIAGLIEKAFSCMRKGGHLMIVEPALLLTSRRLLRIRDMLVERGYPLIAPCLFRNECPALKREGNTCHTDRAWDPPSIVRDIARGAGLHKDALKMSFLIIGHKGTKWPQLTEGRVFRIVSEILESNKRLRLVGCGPDGRIGLSIQEKDFTEGNRVFLRLQRGDVIKVTGAEERESGIALTEGSRISILARAGRPLPEPWEWKG